MVEQSEIITDINVGSHRLLSSEKKRYYDRKDIH